jgi:uracil phosphoribosyltransferase
VILALAADSQLIAPHRVATGGSCIKAIEVLLSHGVQEDRIIFLNLVCPTYQDPSPHHSIAVTPRRAHPWTCSLTRQIASPEGTHNVCTRFPKLRMASTVPAPPLVRLD